MAGGSGSSRLRSFGEERRWIARVLVAFVASLALGWFLPNGLNQIARLTGQQEVPSTPLVHFFSFAMAFFLTVSVELLLWTRRQTANAVQDVGAAVESGLAAGVAGAVSQVVVQSVLPHRDATPAQAARNAQLLGVYADVLSTIPSAMLDGYSVLVEGSLGKMESDLRSVSGSGLEVDIQRHIEITRRLTAGAKSFLQINRKTFRVPHEWTEEWLRLVDELGTHPSLAKQYIVLMSEDDLTSRSHEIGSMAEYLQARGWQMSICSLEKVRDGLGNSVPTSANLDVYDGRFAKLQTSPQGRYRGGINLKMTLVDLNQRPEIGRFVNAVVQYAQRPGQRS